MKKFILLIGALIFSTTFLHSNPPDNCLWAPVLTPGIGAGFSGVFNDQALDNSDSTLFIDTCGLWELNPNIYLDSGKYIGYPSLKAGVFYEQTKRYYSKSMWELAFNQMPAIWLFDTLGKDLNSMIYFTADDIDTNYKQIYDGFQQTRTKYGEIRIRIGTDSHKRNASIREQLEEKDYKSQGLILETVNIVNSEEFAEDLGNSTKCYVNFRTKLIYPVSILENPNPKMNISNNNEILKVFTNEPIYNLEIFSVTGIKIMDFSKESYGKTEMNIEISNFPTGIYFININNSFHKISVVR